MQVLESSTTGWAVVDAGEYVITRPPGSKEIYLDVFGTYCLNIDTTGSTGDTSRYAYRAISFQANHNIIIYIWAKTTRMQMRAEQ